MKTDKKGRQNGVMLLEAVVYLSVLVILLGIGTITFDLMWNNSTALRYRADEITKALRAGETWRRDIRTATGTIRIQEMTNGVSVSIPHGKSEVVYRFTDGELVRQANRTSEVLLERVKASQMAAEPRGDVKAWSWELELTPHRSRSRMPLLFSFEAVAG